MLYLILKKSLNWPNCLADEDNDGVDSVAFVKMMIIITIKTKGINNDYNNYDNVGV